MTDTQTETVTTDPADSPVHSWFGLDGSSYLVLHRTLLQSMPTGWQERMVACLREFGAAFDHVDQAEGYQVEAVTGHEVSELDGEQLAEAGITADWFGGETPPEGLSEEDLAEWEAEHESEDGPVFYRDGEVVDGGELVMLPAEDPVPDYDRGRACIEPRL